LELDHSSLDQPPLLKVFEGILASQSFDLVESFASEDLWKSLLPQEKELLSQLFLIHGERLQSEHDGAIKALRSFRSACSLTPNKARVWFRLGSQLALCDSVNELIESKEALERSLSLDDGFFDAWYTLANVFVRLALKQNNEQFLLEAHSAFERGSRQFEKNTTTTDVGCPPAFYWHWGLSWFLYGRCTGEPSELQHALTLYKKAYALGISSAEFFNDYGNATIEFAILTGQPSLFEQSLSLYEMAVSLSTTTSPEREVHLFNLGCCYQHRYEQFFEQEYFDKAFALYEEAAALRSSFSSVWFKWGQLIFAAARYLHDSELLDEAIEKFQKAHSLGNEHPVLLALWAEAEAFLGSLYDRADSLATALHRAETALNITEQYVECWHALVTCLFELGRYFSDSKYFEKAKGIVERGLAIHPKSALLWRMLGIIKGALGEGQQSPQLLQEALLCFHLSSNSWLQKHPGFWSDWGVVLINLAEILQDERIAHEAIEKFEKAVELVEDPDPQWFFNCGWAFGIIGECTEKEEWFERSAQCFDFAYREEPEFHHAKLHAGLSLFHLSLLTGHKETYLMAAQRVEEYLELEYEDDSAWEDMASIYLHLIEMDPNPTYIAKTVHALNQTLALGNQRALYYFACLHALIGAYSDAMEDLQLAVEAGVIPIPEEIESESWFAILKDHPTFQEFLLVLKQLFRANAIGEQALENINPV